MKYCVLLFVIALAVSADLPHRYMALRGWEISGSDLKDTGIKNVRGNIVEIKARWTS